jgi:hypothetical protein
MMNQLAASLLFFLCLAQSSQEPDPLMSEGITGPLGVHLDQLLTRFAEYGFSGTVLVARDGEIVLLKGYGMADGEHGIHNTASTRFEMNSMTKMFTGVAVDRVIEEINSLPPSPQQGSQSRAANRRNIVEICSFLPYCRRFGSLTGHRTSCGV